MLSDKTIYVVSTGAKSSMNVRYLLDELKKFRCNCVFMPTPMCCSIIDLEKLNNYTIKKDYSFNIFKDSKRIEEEDLIIVAPCTFDTFSKIAHGIADNYPLSIIHAAIGKNKPVIIAPAMDLAYWKHPITESNFAIISSFSNVSIVYPELIYNEKLTLERVTMAPWDKIIDNVLHKYSKIKYMNQKREYDISSIVNAHYPEFYETGNHLQNNQYSNGKAGFIAKRICEGVLVTTSGSCIGNLSRDDLSLVHDSKNNEVIWSGKSIPSSEMPLIQEIFNEFTGCDCIIHGHCKDITYSSRISKYNSMEYLKYGEWNELYKIKPVLDIYKKGIMKMHGEIIISKTFKDALLEYFNMYKESCKTS